MSRHTVLLALSIAACGNDRALTEPGPVAAGAPARLRLLTDAQYGNAVHDLLGQDIVVPRLQTPGAQPHQFIHDDLVVVDSSLLVQYEIAAESIAQQLVARGDTIDSVDLAERAFRRPLGADELVQVQALAAQGGISLVAQAVFQAPSFVYRSELGADAGDGLVELDAYELAQELSFTFLDSVPDPGLWDAAQRGDLTDPDELAAQVDRLLALPRVHRHLTDVVLDWLGAPGVLSVGKDPQRFPEWNADLAHSMYAETEAFVDDVLWRRDGSLKELLTSNSTFIDRRLAEIYGIAGVTSDAPEAISLDPRRRSGVLTQASILAGLATEQRESIIRRGMFVRRKLLCLPDPGRPPFAAIVAEASFTDAMTESQFSFFRLAHVYCSGCHSSIDPAGRALHHYDGIGRWRETDEIDSPIESDAAIAIGDADVRVDGAVSLARALASNDHVGRCVVDQLANHVFGRPLTDPVVRATVYARFHAAGDDIVEAFRALATSPAFRYRRGEP